MMVTYIKPHCTLKKKKNNHIIQPECIQFLFVNQSYLNEAGKNGLLLPTLSSRVPAGVLLPGVFCTNRTRPSWVQKQRKALFFDQRMESCRIAIQSTRSPPGRGPGCFTGIPSAGRGQVLKGRAQLCCSHSRSQCGAQHRCTRPPVSKRN